MPEIPECLHRRYKALDDLISELSALQNRGSHDDCFGDSNSHDPGIKLMCDFWNILKEDPDCNLSQAVKHRMGLEERSSASMFQRQNVTCFRAGSSGGRNPDNRKKDAINKIRDICCGGSETRYYSDGIPASTSRENTPKPMTPEIPLTKALCNLKEAASLEKKCNLRVMELMKTQKELKTQIQILEMREKEGMKLLKEADSMWSCMEEEYKKKIAESLERQKELLAQLKEVEKSNNKWRKNKKDLEDQLKTVYKSRQEIKEKVMQKKNDMKVIEMEMTDFTKRIANNKRLSDASKQTLNRKKIASDKRIADITSNINKVKIALTEAQKFKKGKEEDGQKFVRDARADLQKICKMLLEKKIENEDLLAENEAVKQEIDILKQSCDMCRDKCQAKRDNIEEEIKRVEQATEDYKYQCVRCHQYTDTTDARNLCSDCPKCKEKRECLTSEDHCDRDPAYDCVCIGVKEKFLSNVFENMYTVLERQSKTKPGKALADSILKCLKNSRNGKLDNATRQQVQEFLLNTIKKNLNLTVIGGAVKTRCEMDDDTYKQLMTCLTHVTVENPVKEDKGTVAKKESCRRWVGSTECNCPGGVKKCACNKRAPPPPPKPPVSCPPVMEDEKEDKHTVVLCPHKEPVGCGPHCAVYGTPNSGVGSSKENQCADTDCPFKRNVRAAQCVLGPDPLSSLPKTYMSSTPFIPRVHDGVKCRCANTRNSCMCKDAKQLKAKYCNNNTCVGSGHLSVNDIYHGISLKHSKHMKPLIKTKQRKPLSSSISSQAMALAENICDVDSFFKQKSYLKMTKEIQSKICEYDTLAEQPISNLSIERKERYTGLIDAKSCEDLSSFSSSLKSNSEHLVDFNSKHTKFRLLDFNKKSDDAKVAKKFRYHGQSSITSICQKPFLNSNISVKNSNNVNILSIHSLTVLKSELQQRKEENKTVVIKLKNNTGPYRTVRSSITNTLSGNLAIDLNKLSNDLSIKRKESNVALTRSASGGIILSQDQQDVANSVLRRTSSGSLLLVLTDPVFRTKKSIKTIASIKEKYFKVQIESNEYNTADPPAVLKSTPSLNYLVVPDKEYELQYKETIEGLLDDGTEYFVSLRTTDSQNCVLQVDDSWEDNKPNALVVKTDSGNVKILTKRNTMVSVDSGRKRISVTSSSRILGGIIEKIPKKVEEKQSSPSPKKSMLSKKLNSNSNVHKNVNLFYSDHKDSVSKPVILRASSSDQYAIILDKESKPTFINNLRNYLTNKFQGLVPIKTTKSGQVTIALNSDQTNNNLYGSLKLTPSGNIYVVIDNEQMTGLAEEQGLHQKSENSNITDLVSSHFIGQLEHPVNKSVTTTCNSRSEKDCDKSKHVFSDTNIENVDWVLDYDQIDKSINFFGTTDWKDVSCTSRDICEETSTGNFSDNFTDRHSCKGLPHIIIRPCPNKPLLDGPSDNKEQLFYVIEAVCPLDQNMPYWPATRVLDEVQNDYNWDTLRYLPPQLPEFLRGVVYNKF